jgi:hypothetical protein
VLVALSIDSLHRSMPAKRNDSNTVGVW